MALMHKKFREESCECMSQEEWVEGGDLEFDRECVIDQQMSEGLFLQKRDQVLFVLHAHNEEGDAVDGNCMEQCKLMERTAVGMAKCKLLVW